jgi:hypothetical protein
MDEELCDECGEEGHEGETDDGLNLCFVCYNEWLDKQEG